jgi:dsDNA-specific endonuclease/ATPase MutS2
VQLEEKQDTVSAREKLSHYTAKMIGSKAKANMYHKNGHSSLSNIYYGLRNAQRKVKKRVKKFSKIVKKNFISCQQVDKQIVKKLSKSCQKAVKNCQNCILEKFVKLLYFAKNTDMVAKAKIFETVERRGRTGRRYVVPRPGATLSHLVKINSLAAKNHT